MTTPTASEVKELRERTGAGMMDCKAALAEAGGDMDKAVELLRVRGQAQAAKRGGRETGEGVVESYVHANGKIGVIVEVDCETDFVARNADFRDFAREVALHVAAAAPLYVSEDGVPEEVRSAELQLLVRQAAEEASGKPEEVQRKIAEGRLRKWVEQVALLSQAHVNADKHEGRTIEELRAQVASATGENVIVRRFARFQVGEGE